MVDEDKVVCKWYLSPRQHIIEWIAFHAILVPLIYVLSKTPWEIDVPRIPPRVSSSDVWKRRGDESIDHIFMRARKRGGWLLKFVERVSIALSWVTLIATIYYKQYEVRNSRPPHVLLLDISNAIVAITYRRAL